MADPDSSRYLRGTVSREAGIGGRNADGDDESSGGGGSQFAARSGDVGGGYSGSGGSGGYGKFVSEGEVKFVPHFSADGNSTKVELCDAPLGAPLAKNVTKTYGIDKATFVLQSASDDTMQCVAFGFRCCDEKFLISLLRGVVECS